MLAEDPNTSFDEVHLLVGSQLIARVDIDQPRPDVSQRLGRDGTPGFVMPLPLDFGPLDWKSSARLLAVSADGTSMAELSLRQNKANTSEQLLALLNSEQLGMDGHVDGILHGELRGWACRRGQLQPAQIWLHAKGQHPLSISCAHWRDGMMNQQLPNQCGFSVDVDSLPPNWAGQSIWCSFDKAGEWRIPQNETLVVPAGPRSATLVEHHNAEISSVVTTSYKAQLETAPEDFQQHWRTLEEFRMFLDCLEVEVQRRESLLVSQRKLQGNPSLHLSGLLRKLLRGH